MLGKEVIFRLRYILWTYASIKRKTINTISKYIAQIIFNYLSSLVAAPISCHDLSF